MILNVRRTTFSVQETIAEATVRNPNPMEIFVLESALLLGPRLP
jgi:hypothetical protein